MFERTRVTLENIIIDYDSKRTDSFPFFCTANGLLIWHISWRASGPAFLHKEVEILSKTSARRTQRPRNAKFMNFDGHYRSTDDCRFYISYDSYKHMITLGLSVVDLFLPKQVFLLSDNPNDIFKIIE